MGLIRVRDFAKECGCTPQNIYKHIRNYATELDGHVLDSARGKLLDEFACDFIREAMYPRELDTGSEVTKMAQELAELRAAFMKLGQENLRIASELLQTQGERDRALLDLQQHRKLLQAAEDAEEARQAELAKAHQEASEVARRAAENEKILEGFIQDAKAEIAALSEEKALADARAAEEAKRADAAEADNAALKGRGLLARIFRKGE